MTRHFRFGEDLCITSSSSKAFHVIMQNRLHEENERCLLYLDGSTRKLLVATAEKQLLSRHTAAILEKVK
jgi:hypothetical protein